MVEQMVELGFKRIELSHGIRLSLVPGILRAVEEGIVEVPSIHNFCPLPSSVQHAAPNFYQPASSNTSERALWMRYSLQTLNFAKNSRRPDTIISLVIIPTILLSLSESRDYHHKDVVLYVM